MTIACKWLKVNVKVVSQANAVGPTSIEDSFFTVSQVTSQAIGQPIIFKLLQLFNQAQKMFDIMQFLV